MQVWSFVFSIRFMDCMGGLAENLTCNSTIRGCIDTGNTLHCTQYITSWPFTHPCCAPHFFSLHMKCDTKQRNCAFHRALHHLKPIRDPCYFSFVAWVLLLFPHCNHVHVKVEMVLVIVYLVLFWGSNSYINGVTARCRCYLRCICER